MATALSQTALPAQNPFLQRVVTAPTGAVTAPWRMASTTIFRQDTAGNVHDTGAETMARVAACTFTQHQNYLAGPFNKSDDLDNIISGDVDTRAGQADTRHWAYDRANNCISKERAIFLCHKEKDAVKRDLFESLRGGVHRAVVTMGGLATWQQAQVAERLKVFYDLFEEDPLAMARLSAGSRIANDVINFHALYHHQQMMTPAGDDLADLMRRWVRWKFAHTCEIIFQAYEVAGTERAKRQATTAWRELYQTWTQNVMQMDETLIDPENWPVFS